MSTRTRPKQPSKLGRNLIFLGVTAVFLVSVLSVGIRWERLLDLPSDLARIFGQMFLPPDWSFLSVAIEAMIVTVAIAWLGTLIGALLSLPMGFLAARNVSGGVLSTAARLILDAIRAVPELILALIVFIPIVGLGPPAGALAIGIHSIGTLGKLTSEAIESIDPGPVEAARAVGGGRLAVQRWGVIPQVLPEIVAFWLYRFEINIRAAGVLGIVGAGGIGALLANTLFYRRWDKAGMAVLVIIIATILIDMASGWVRRRIIEGAEGKSDGAEGGDEQMERLDTWSGAASGALANVEPAPNKPSGDRAPS
jgi:phosphonate transport system permease protein